jgi:phosphoribosylcarboxyaminoimidazole (NCAIR) mutase
MSKAKNKRYVRNVGIQLDSKKDMEIVQKALVILDKAGYTIASKNDLVLESDV